jgi:hypothetical protein
MEMTNLANERNDALKDYVEVNVRIERFWAKYPNGRIDTQINFLEGTTPQEVLVKANEYPDIADSVPGATGHAHEVHGSSYINRTSFIENAETSAVGRAIAILGFEIKKSVASREEVANAQHQQTQTPQPVQSAPQASDKPSEAQIKMLNVKAAQCGYTKTDAHVLIEIISKQLGYKIEGLADVKKADVNKLAEFLGGHKKRETSA